SANMRPEQRPGLQPMHWLSPRFDASSDYGGGVCHITPESSEPTGASHDFYPDRKFDDPQALSLRSSHQTEMAPRFLLEPVSLRVSTCSRLHHSRRLRKGQNLSAA